MDKGKGRSGEAGESHHHAAVTRLRRVESVAVVFGGRGPRSLRAVMRPGWDEGRGIAAAVERTPSVHEEDGELLHRPGPPQMNLADMCTCRLWRRSQIPFPLSTHQLEIAHTARHRRTPERPGRPGNGAPKGQAPGPGRRRTRCEGDRLKIRSRRRIRWQRPNTSTCSAPATRT